MNIRIADVINSLRQELSNPLLNDETHDVAFELQKVELELSVSLATSDEVASGIKFYVVNLGATSTEREVHTQKLKLVLNAFRRADHSVVRVNSDEPQARA